MRFSIFVLAFRGVRGKTLFDLFINKLMETQDIFPQIHFMHSLLTQYAPKCYFCFGSKEWHENYATKIARQTTILPVVGQIVNAKTLENQSRGFDFNIRLTHRMFKIKCSGGCVMWHILVLLIRNKIFNDTEHLQHFIEFGFQWKIWRKTDVELSLVIYLDFVIVWISHLMKWKHCLLIIKTKIYASMPWFINVWQSKPRVFLFVVVVVCTWPMLYCSSKS